MLNFFLYGLLLSGLMFLGTPSVEASGSSQEAQISCIDEPDSLTPKIYNQLVGREISDGAREVLV